VKGYLRKRRKRGLLFLSDLKRRKKKSKKRSKKIESKSKILFSVSSKLSIMITTCLKKSESWQTIKTS
jgi:hypothetical protein